MGEECGMKKERCILYRILVGKPERNRPLGRPTRKCEHKRMLRWFPRLQAATACFSCSPPNLNFLDPYFIFMWYVHNNHCHRVTDHLQLNTLLLLGTAVAQWLRCSATNRKVASSIPASVSGYFTEQNPSDRTMALRSTQPLI